jgi:hypothetical protein
VRTWSSWWPSRRRPAGPADLVLVAVRSLPSSCWPYGPGPGGPADLVLVAVAQCTLTILVAPIIGLGGPHARPCPTDLVMARVLCPAEDRWHSNTLGTPIRWVTSRTKPKTIKLTTATKPQPQQNRNFTPLHHVVTEADVFATSVKQKTLPSVNREKHRKALFSSPAKMDFLLVERTGVVSLVDSSFSGRRTQASLVGVSVGELWLLLWTRSSFSCGSLELLLWRA